MHLDLFLGHPEVFGHLVAQAPGPFIRRPDFDASIGVNLHRAGAGLDVAVMRKRRAERVLEDTRRLLKSGFNIAVLPQHVGLKVVTRHAFRQFGRVAIFISVIMDQRRSRLQRLHWIFYVRQFLIFNINEPNRLVGDFFAVGGHRRHRIAAHAHFVISQHRLVFDPRADENVFHIGPGENSADALQRLGLRGIDFNDARMRHRSAQHLSPQ